jgi:hypothetical protein
MSLRLETLIAIGFLVSLELALTAVISFNLPVFEFLAVAVQLVTILALLFPVYAVWRQNLERKRRLVEDVRIWADHFDLISRQFVDPVQLHPSQVSNDDVKAIRVLSNKAADHLAEALARGFRVFRDSSPITNLISALRTFARNEKFLQNKGLFIQEIVNLRPKTQAVTDLASGEYAKATTRYGLPQRCYAIVTSRIVGRVAIVTLVICTLLWAIVVVLRVLGS